ncbi:MAG: YdcF family protein [Oricola sp.]
MRRGAAGEGTMFFILSKIGWLLIQPLGLLAAALAVLFLLALRRKAGFSAVLAGVSLAGLLAASQTNAGRLLLQPLENRYARPASSPAPDDVAGIIVLGGGFDGFVTVARGGFELGDSGDRFVEAVRLARLYPQVPVVVSGGEAALIGHAEGDASIAPRFFEALGIDASRLILEDRSLNTYQNAVLTRAVLPNDAKGKWLLVTSAFHMPRSVGAFRKQGVPIIPWPVDYRTSGRETLSFGRNNPAAAMGEFSDALREWLGLLVYRMTGRIDGW